MKLDELKKSKGDILDEIDNILANEDLTDEQLEEVETKQSEVEKITKKIEVLEKQSKFDTVKPVDFSVQETNKDEKDLVKNYKITKHILGAGGNLDGAEAEMHREAEKEATNQKKPSLGNVCIPSRYFQLGAKKRDLTIGTEGADVEFDQFGGVIPILRATPIISTLGAQTFQGLSGDLRLPRHNTAASMAWEGETDAGAETTPTFNQVLLQPKRLGGYTQISGQFLRQAVFAAEAWVRNELNTALTLALDSASISGATGGDNPVGILNIAGIGSVAQGTNGGAPDWASVINLRREVAEDNAANGALAYLSNPQVTASLMSTPKVSTTDSVMIMNEMGRLAGYNYAESTQVPSNLDKGTSTGVCSAMIYGNFNEAMFGQFGVIDLIVDPYSSAKNGLLDIVINGYFDFAVRHAESFAAVQDYTTA